MCSQTETMLHVDPLFSDCVVPENIHTPPMEGFFKLTPPPPTPTPPEIPFWCHTFIQKLWLLKPPSPLEFSINLPWGAHGYFLELHITRPHNGRSGERLF